MLNVHAPIPYVKDDVIENIVYTAVIVLVCELGISQ